MPSQYIHTVLTSGDSVAVGTNFLSEGHSNQIMKAIIEEDSVREHEKIPGMLEMLAILMLKAPERCMITPDFLRLHRVIENRYQESEAVAVSCIFSSQSFRIKLSDRIKYLYIEAVLWLTTGTKTKIGNHHE